ncbi:TatD family hydrolase [Hutsoniella sourekii]|uniref:TatD family hydrolase n=1 Tax=Hutsoniella sourekii TaxID=87650 RepID=UPI0004834AED|nr:TatD family hydrolase [Hutsoniella sourekii]
MKLFDTHTHLNVRNFLGREEEVIAEAAQAGVEYMAVVGFDQETIAKSLELSRTYPNIISVIGWHPTEAKHYNQAIEDQLHQWLEQPKVHMLGEIGLDYYWDDSPIDVQKKVFARLIAIAKEHQLPITIHNREATEDVYKILQAEKIPEAGGIMHSFGEGPEWAQRFLDLGMHISYSGVATFKKTDDVRESARLTPIDRLLIETDAPYLAPVPKRGKENQPAYVRYVAECLANVKKISLEEFAEQTCQNAFNLFNWWPEEEANHEDA